MDRNIPPPLPDEATEARLSVDYSRFLLAAIVDSCDDAIVSKDLNGIITTWNQSATAIFGYEAEEMIGQSVLKLIPRELHSEEDVILSKIRKRERIDHYESTRVRKDGERIRVSLTISPLCDDYGTVIGASKIARDISDRQQNEETRARLAAIVASSDDAIISRDLGGSITSWNEAATRLYGYSAEEMIGSSVLRIIPREFHSEEGEILEKLRAGERIDHYETRRITKSGEIVDVSLTISPVRDSRGRIIGSSKIARDISARKRMEHSIIQSEKLAATGRMAATIAHEINNPLDAVMNLVYLARQNIAPRSKARPYLLTAEKELDRVSHIARQTLGYYRDPGIPTQLQLQELFEDLLTVYHTKLIGSNIAVDCRFETIPPILASRGELMQVFSNLITNAIDAMRGGGTLSIHLLERVNEGLEVIVQDQGTGISSENMSRIFEPFFTTKGNLGTGIGLWVAKQLIEKHSGTIRVESSTVSPDTGTTFTLFLPLPQQRNSDGPEGELR